MTRWKDSINIDIFPTEIYFRQFIIYVCSLCVFSLCEWKLLTVVFIHHTVKTRIENDTFKLNIRMFSVELERFLIIFENSRNKKKITINGLLALYDENKYMILIF